MAMPPRNIGVVVTTYNSPAWLTHALTGYGQQTHRDFRIIVADDGSSAETRAVVERFSRDGEIPIEHVWHEDRGFRKCTILNKAIAATACDYLIFMDGDCIPHRDFVAVHAAEAGPGRFLSGGYVKLTMPVSRAITEDDIRSGRVFDRGWLIARGQPRSHKLLKLVGSRRFKRLFNALTPTSATWNGMNSSAWTRDIVAVNGFNEDMQYGGLDREFGERLLNNGLRSRQVRYSAVCVHLEHSRGYANAETRARNDAIRRRVREERRTWAANGISKDRA